MTRFRQTCFSLDSTIDPEVLRKAFAASGRVQISPFLDGESANRLRVHLQSREDWRLALNADGKRPLEFDRPTWETMSPSQREALKRIAAPNAPTGFRYLFEQIVAVDDETGSREPETLLGQFAEFLSSTSVLELARTITGEADIAFADARATCYGCGHFLTMHHDQVEGSHRRAAYVFGLTQDWRPEWGGLLMFHDDSDDVVLGLVPRMNVLNLFAVPQDHSVSLVSPFAPSPRYSVTGWLRAMPLVAGGD